MVVMERLSPGHGEEEEGRAARGGGCSACQALGWALHRLQWPPSVP